MEKSRPKVIISAAISIDGKLATKKGDSALSSGKDLKRMHKLRSQADAILVGINTLLTDNPSLTVRYAKGQNPARIVLDSEGKTPLNCKMVQQASKIATIVITTDRIRLEKKNHLAKAGVEVVSCGATKINLRKMLQMLSKRGIQILMVEGGGETNWSFVKESLVDEIRVTVSPFVLGGANSVSLVAGKGFSEVTKSLKMRLEKVQKNWK